AWNDPLARHKSLNYWSRRLAFEEARRQGFDEVLCISPGSYYSYYWEGSRTNLFLIRNVSLSTPCLDGPIVPGVMRALVLEHARELPLVDVHEETGLRMGEIREADEIFLTNSVRGIIPVARAGYDDRHGGFHWIDWPAPGPWTQRIWLKVSD